MEHRIVLINEYVAKGLDEARKKHDQLNTSLEEGDKKTRSLLRSFTELRWMLVNIALVVGTVKLLTSITIAAEKTQFELKRLAMVTGESFGAVSSAVMDLRDQTMASNEELISSFQELAKSGFSLAESQSILAASSGASLVGFSSLKDTAMATAQVMRQFGIDSDRAADTAYKLAAVANEGKVDINTLGQALKFSGAIADQAGTSMEELASLTALLSNKGLELSQIGRGTRQMFISLLSPTGEAEALMRAFNVQITDTSGNLKPITEVLDEFNLKLGGLTDAEKQNVLGKIFPSNALTVVLESMGEISKSTQALSSELDLLASEANLKSLSLMTEYTFTWASAWEELKLKSQSTITSLITFFAEGFGMGKKNIDEYQDAMSELSRKTTEYLRERQKQQKEGGEPTEPGTRDFSATIAAYSERYKVAREKVEEYNEQVKQIKEIYGDTTEAQQIINQNLNDFIEILGISQEGGSDVVKMFQDMIKEQDDLADSTDNLSDYIWEYQLRLKELQRELRAIGNELSDVRSEISATESEISSIQSRRFNIRGISETDIAHIISVQQLEMKKAQFAALGLGTAEEFLRDASVITTDSIDQQTEAIRKLTEAYSDGQDEYDAWKTALSETIKALILNSQDLDKDVTSVVRNAQTELLGFTNFDRRKSGQFDAMQRNLDTLGLAQDIFFGEEREQLQYSEQQYQDRTQGMNESAAQAIANLESERETLANLLIEEENWMELQRQKEEEMDRIRELIDAETEAWNRRNRAQSGSSTSTGEGGSKAPPTTANQVRATSAADFIAELTKEQMEYRANPANTSNAAAPFASEEIKRKFTGPYYSDFVARPGQPVQRFSPEDTIVGVKDPGKMLNKTIQVGNIIIQGYQKDAKQLAIEIQRQIQSLA